MRRALATAAIGSVLVSALVACDGSSGDTDPTATAPTTTVSTPPQSEIEQHETVSGSPIGYGLSVPDGATQLGPLIRRRSPTLIAAYKEILDKAERLDAIQKLQKAKAKAEAGETVGTPTPTPSALPSRDTYNILDEAPPPDITQSLMRVDGDPGEVFERVLEQVDKSFPGLEIEPKAWSQYCKAANGLYTGCSATFSGRTDKDADISDTGVRVAVTLDPGNVKTKMAPAGSGMRPLLTVTTSLTDPPDTSKAIADETGTASTPPPTTPPTSPPPVTQGPEVAAKWPKMTTLRSASPGDAFITPKWLMRPDTTLLLSGERPAFALLVVKRSTNADAVARGYVLPYSSAGTPVQDIAEDRNEISTTYTAVAPKGGPRVWATYTQTGRGNYVALFYVPAA